MGNKKDRLLDSLVEKLGAGSDVTLETVDFADPYRPRTCLEVDFPIIPINQVATIEGNSGKPIYQISKYWARRRSSVFRSLLLAAATKAPANSADAGKVIWDSYYKRHCNNEAFRKLKVADVFMGGGTTLIEGTRLGMQMYGIDLNPISLFVVQNELKQCKREDFEGFVQRIENEVRPQIIPFYAMNCPRGHVGVWKDKNSHKVMEDGFDPLATPFDERGKYNYAGPELIYVFWAKHGPCLAPGCTYRTPLISEPLFFTKEVVVRAWRDQKCVSCEKLFDVEDGDTRMAPKVIFYNAETSPFAVLDKLKGVSCPHCSHHEKHPVLGKATAKKVQLSLVIHSRWLKGANGVSADGNVLGGKTDSTAEETVRWNRERANTAQLYEVRGVPPAEFRCPVSGVTVYTDSRGGNISRKSTFVCQSSTCGREQDVLESIAHSKSNAPVAAYAVQGFCPECAAQKTPGGGRFFVAFDDTRSYDAALKEWEHRREKDLNGYWPVTEVRPGLETSVRTPLERYGYKKWVEFFNGRQLIGHSLLLKTISTASNTDEDLRSVALAAFQQSLRSNNMFCIWDFTRNHLAPFLSKNNFQPPTRPVENSVFHKCGRGNWNSCKEGVLDALDWARSPWEVLAKDYVQRIEPSLASAFGTSKGIKLPTRDPVEPERVTIACSSATELRSIESGTIDLVITDPPFGDIMQYAELSDFFYAWLHPALKSTSPEIFGQPHPPTALEAVENRSRHGSDTSQFYKRLLTEVWKEANRILKPGGTLAFTFHHDKDEPWVAVLESLFDAGFYLEATYPIRSDETKGEGATPGTFGAQKVEYDIIHVCGKRFVEPQPVSWGRMRREVIADVGRIQTLIETHAKQGLPAADLQVIMRGKALEYYSRHYGKVYVEENHNFSVREALLGINQILQERSSDQSLMPPSNAEPYTREFLRIFDGKSEVPRDQLQKFLRSTGIAPSEFVEKGWCKLERKVYCLTDPKELAQAWSGRQRRALTNDYDQAMFLIGACYDGSGINVLDNLKNENFKAHPALGPIIEWMVAHGGKPEMRSAATRALKILRDWQGKQQDKTKTQMALFEDEVKVP